MTDKLFNVGDKVRMTDTFSEEGVVIDVNSDSLTLRLASGTIVTRSLGVRGEMGRTWETLEAAPKWKDGDVARVKEKAPAYNYENSPNFNLRFRLNGSWQASNGLYMGTDETANQQYTLIFRDGKPV